MLLLNASERKPQPQESAEKAAWQQSDSRPLLNDSIRQLSPLAKCQDAPIPVCYSDQLHTHDEGWRNLSSFASFQRDGAAATNGFRACYVPRAVCKGSVERPFFPSLWTKSSLSICQNRNVSKKTTATPSQWFCYHFGHHTMFWLLAESVHIQYTLNIITSFNF